MFTSFAPPGGNAMGESRLDIDSKMMDDTEHVAVQHEVENENKHGFLRVGFHSRGYVLKVSLWKWDISGDSLRANIHA